MNRTNRHASAAIGTSRTASVFLALAVAALAIAADRIINVWSDSPVLLAWIALSVVVFIGMALFTDGTRRLAQQVAPAINNWLQSMAEARADMRTWEAARQDPRLRQELQLARERNASNADFNDALAPLGA